MTDSIPTPAARRPLTSVVIETVTAREDHAEGPLTHELERAIMAIAAQRYPQDRIEVIVVLDDESRAFADDIRRRFPGVGVAFSVQGTYCDAKNAGARLARGEIVALLDGDCTPDHDWLGALVSRIEAGADAVAGRTRYVGTSLAAATFSVPDFANIVEKPEGEASGFNLNNVAFRRQVLMEDPFDPRVPRNGGCYLLYHTMRAHGRRVVYEPRAVVAHGLDIRGLGFLRKHFDRGYDGTHIYRIDDAQVLRGTRVFKRFGPVGLIALVGRRLALDLHRIVRYRRQIGMSLWTLPYYAAVMTTTRLIELAGGLTAALRRSPSLDVGTTRP
jgi:glycosyltransferase involved in cell wall biosynthesis